MPNFRDVLFKMRGMGIIMSSTYRLFSGSETRLSANSIVSLNIA